MSADIRRPSVAGQFYPASRTELIDQIEQCFLGDLGPGALPQPKEHGPRQILGVISPHAGYVFSGATASHGYLALAEDGLSSVVVVVGVNHGRGGFASAVQTSGAWQTPLGEVPIDEEVAGKIAAALPGFVTDPRALVAEHSIEVQLPFLQYVYEESLIFVPVMMAAQDIGAARAVGNALFAALDERDGVVVASSDMTHYESAESARRKDHVLIERIEALDAEGLISQRDARAISMCGAGPVAAAIIAAKQAGAARVDSLAYSTSGDVMPASEVVGYYSAVICR